MAGQKHRLATPATGPMADALKILNEARTRLGHAIGTKSLFASFDFAVKHMRFSTSYLGQGYDVASKEATNAAQREAVTMQELLHVTGETNALDTATRLTSPTILSEDIEHAILHIAMHVDNPHWKYLLGQYMLLMGDYDLGAQYHWFRPTARGEGVLNVSLKGEQGLGDELFFARYISKREKFRCATKLCSILSRNGYNIVKDIQPNEYPIGDWFSGVLPSITLAPSDHAKRAILSEIGGYPKPWTAVTLTAGIDYAAQRGPLWSMYKEFPLNKWVGIQLNTAGTVFIIDRMPLPLIRSAYNHIRMPAINDDLEDTLAFLSLMDHYIGVSNTNTHLYATLGKTAHVLIPWVPEWRWGLKDESLFFPGFPTYRQTPNGSWDTATAKLIDALRQLQVIK